MKNNKVIAILDEHEFWLDPLYEELKKRNVPYKKIDISSESYSPFENKNYSFYVNRLSPSSKKRGNDASINFALNYILDLETKGIRVINGSQSVLLETSKAYQASLLLQHGFLTPKTWIFNNLTDLKSFFSSDKINFPILIKPNCGGSGMEIKKFHSQDSFLSALNKNEIEMPTEKILVLQEYIKPKDGYIVRVEIIGGKFVYAMKVFTDENFNLCPSEKCDLDRSKDKPLDLGYCVATPKNNVKFELFNDYEQSFIDQLVYFTKKVGLECAGIEYLVDDKKNKYVYDINALSILRSTFKLEYNIDAWSILADYIVSEAKKTNSSSSQYS